MSILIDSLKNMFDETHCVKDNRTGREIHVVAKPIPYFSLVHRIKDAFRVLTGKSIAVHYYTDN